MRDRVLILSVLIVASCGLGYELISSALASYLLGDSILQFSSVIGCYLFAMGIGSWLSKYVKDDDVLNRFIDVELAVALLGGVSAAVLFLVFAWLSAPFRAALYAGVFIIGLMVGMEIPLVMRVFNQRKAEFREIVSRVLTFDYLGALAVSLIFPLLLAPKLGLLRTSFLFGMLNAGVALWTTWLFRAEIRRPAERAMRGCVVLGLLALGFLFSGQMTAWAEKGLYGDDVVHAETTPYQRLVVTRWHDDLRLYINGNLQFSSRDEHRYHESLVIPGLQALPWARNVLVLGGGDGLAVREILKYKHVEHVTLVDLDPAMTGLFKSNAMMTALNGNALNDARVSIVNTDAFHWLQETADTFDVIVVDFPDPTNFAIGKLFTNSFYSLLDKRLAASGYAVIQTTSPLIARRSFWTVVQTVESVGLTAAPYHVHVPSFGEWGFVLASHRPWREPEALPAGMRFLTLPTLRLMFDFPLDMARVPTEVNRLSNQVLVNTYEREWGKVEH